MAKPVVFLAVFLSAFGALAAIKFPLKSSSQNGKMVIADSSGERVKLACVNWAGAHMEEMVVNGLDRRPLDEIAEDIREMGFNCVRLVYALDTLFINGVVPSVRLAANPDLIGSTTMEVFDAVVASLTSKGLMVILNNHVRKRERERDNTREKCLRNAD